MESVPIPDKQSVFAGTALDFSKVYELVVGLRNELLVTVDACNAKWKELNKSEILPKKPD